MESGALSSGNNPDHLGSGKLRETGVTEDSGESENPNTNSLEQQGVVDGNDQTKLDEDGSPIDGSLTPASMTSVPTPSTPPTVVPNCTSGGAVVENCTGGRSVEVGDLKVDGGGIGKESDLKASSQVHRHLLQHNHPHAGLLPASVPLSSVAIHNDLHALTRGSNGASTGSASPASDATTSSVGVPQSGHSPLTNNIMHDSELSSHSFEDNSPAQTSVGSERSGLGVMITRENHSNNDTEKRNEHENNSSSLKDGNNPSDNATTDGSSAKDPQEPHKNVIHVGYALSKEPSLNNLLSDKFLKGLGGMPFLAKPGSMESDSSKGVSLSEDLLGKKGLLKTQAMMQEGDGRNTEVQESCGDEDLLNSSSSPKAHLNLTRCISIPSKLLGRSDSLNPGDKPKKVGLIQKQQESVEEKGDPVNGNDPALRTDLKYSAVGIRTAVWMNRDGSDPLPDRGTISRSNNNKIPEEEKGGDGQAEEIIAEPRPSDVSCMNHTASEGGGSGLGGVGGPSEAPGPEETGQGILDGTVTSREGPQEHLETTRQGGPEANLPAVDPGTPHAAPPHQPGKHYLTCCHDNAH